MHWAHLTLGENNLCSTSHVRLLGSTFVYNNPSSVFQSGQRTIQTFLNNLRLLSFHISREGFWPLKTVEGSIQIITVTLLGISLHDITYHYITLNCNNHFMLGSFL